MLIFGCSNGEQYQQTSNCIVRNQNKSPPDPNAVAEIREVLEWLCDICKEDGKQECMNERTDNEKGKEENRKANPGGH
jgi:predicted secreted protein